MKITMCFTKYLVTLMTLMTLKALIAFPTHFLRVLVYQNLDLGSHLISL